MLELLDGETLEQLSADGGLESALGRPLGLDDLLARLELLERQMLQTAASAPRTDRSVIHRLRR